MTGKTGRRQGSNSLSDEEVTELFDFDWELFHVVLSGKSALDSQSFMASLHQKADIDTFLTNYGFNPHNPVLHAELFGAFQEALQFIRKHFLRDFKDSGPSIEATIPASIIKTKEVGDLFLMAVDELNQYTLEERIWAGIVLKVMHTILHVDKDLRNRYFQTIQQQVFDRFYKYLHRDEKDALFLGHADGPDQIPLVAFETKAKKSRESTIIKMLHKNDSVAEELFDRIGVRLITYKRIDTLRVVKFLQDHYIIMAHNIRPSRSVNSLIDLNRLKNAMNPFIRKMGQGEMSAASFINHVEELANQSIPEDFQNERNQHSSTKYRSLQFTVRQLITFKNPMVSQVNELKGMAKDFLDQIGAKGEEGEGPDVPEQLAKKVLGLDLGPTTNTTRFFYPYEIQIIDEDMYRNNTLGEASHEDYKRSQLKAAMYRIFRPLIHATRPKIYEE